MKKKIITLSILVLVATILTGLYTTVFAKKTNEENQENYDLVYSDAYIEYLKLSDAEKQEYEVIPYQGKIINSTKKIRNPFKAMALVGASSDASYDLRQTIPNNIVVKDQKNLDICWAFSTLTSLQTNLALYDHSLGVSNIPVYDFSERHMDYSLVWQFLNGKTNPYGVTRQPGSAVTLYEPLGYLTNGMGAVDQSEWPLNYTTDTIDINNLNKPVKTEVDDINYYFYAEDTLGKAQLMTLMKSNIEQFGSISSLIYGAPTSSNYYNSETGAVYCDNDETCPQNHVVSIIGWDDNYETNNFNILHRPSNAGAWIAKNSWGTEYGDEGFMYISYDDINVYKELFSIINASYNSPSYDNIYQYDESGPSGTISLNNSKYYIGNKFTKQKSGVEYISKVSISNPQAYTCKVYVNPNGSSINKNDLFQVQLTTGNEIALEDPGYHTIEFQNPIKINSNEFSVVLEISTQGNTLLNVETPNVNGNNDYQNVVISNSKCFLANEEKFNSNNWDDMSVDSIKKDTCLKVFTVNDDDPETPDPSDPSNPEESTLEAIEITKMPNKTSYNAGEDFDPTGMEVTAYYSDTTRVLSRSEYTIVNGTNLSTTQNSVTIRFGAYADSVDITVEGNGSEPEPEPEPNPEQNGTEDPTTNDIPEDPTSEPKNTNLSNLSAKLETISLTSESGSLKILINNFNQASGNDSFEYYFYLSGNPNADLQNASFTKIDNSSITNGKLEFTIDAEDITNYEELQSASDIYLYIKEIAYVGNASSVAYSNALKLSVEKETTIEYTTPEGETYKMSGSDITDLSVADKPIPQTGVSSTMITIIVLISIAGITLLARYIIIQRKMNGK